MKTKSIVILSIAEIVTAIIFRVFGQKIYDYVGDLPYTALFLITAAIGAVGLSQLYLIAEKKIKAMQKEERMVFLRNVLGVALSIIVGLGTSLYLISLPVPASVPNWITVYLICAITLVFSLVPWIPYLLRRYNQPWAYGLN